eukprot:901478-Prorocentrum_minimum.AAC.1
MRAGSAARAAVAACPSGRWCATSCSARRWRSYAARAPQRSHHPTHVLPPSEGDSIQVAKRDSP